MWASERGAALALAAAGARRGRRRRGRTAPRTCSTCATPTASCASSVEVMDDAGERAQGLMFRESLPRFSGMLFVYETPQPVAFWMRNTLIPLDMLFFDGAGRLTRIKSNAAPHDETPIVGGDDVRYVLEINGGLAAELGIDLGAELRHPALDQAAAAWPC